MTSPIRASVRSPEDIARTLSSEFDRALYARLGQSAPPDPVLASLFQSFATQIGRLYQDAEDGFPTAVLDDLMAALGQAPRLAQPAQTVVQFTGIEAREAIPLAAELTGYGRGGEPIVFACDAGFSVTPASLAFAGVLEAGRLVAVPGARVPGTELAVPPGSAPVRQAPEASAVILAIETTDAEHLSDVSVFMDCGIGAAALVAALGSAPWLLLNAEGHHAEGGVLRPVAGPGGVRWLRSGALAARGPDESRVRPLAPAGAYAGRVFVFERLGAKQRTRSLPPSFLRDVLRSLVPPGQDAAYQRPLAWVMIPLPAGIKGVAAALQRIAVNCMSASNLEEFPETVTFDRVGSTVEVRPEGRLDRGVLGVLSVVGEQGEAYVTHDTVSQPEHVGRFRFRAGQLTVQPGRGPTGKIDRYAAVRLLLTDGAAANGVAIGELRHLREALSNNPVAQVTNLAPSRGGSPAPEYGDARLRFADALRTRERFVTAADIEIGVRAFDSRVDSVEVVRRPLRAEEGMRMADVVRVAVRRSALVDAEAEVALLEAELTQYLVARIPSGRPVAVEVRVGEGRT